MQQNSKQRLLLATHNAGKIREMRAFFDPEHWDIVTAADLNLPEPPETGVTFAENATIKALAAFHATKIPALADDSGLCVTALQDWPGVYTANLAGPERDYSRAMKIIHDRLIAAETDDWRAAFVTTLAYATAPDEIRIFEGRIHGRLTWPPRGVNGFGFEPLFIPDGDARTFAEIETHEKNRFSHRARAFQEFFKAGPDLYFSPRRSSFGEAGS